MSSKQLHNPELPLALPSNPTWEVSPVKLHLEELLLVLVQLLLKQLLPNEPSPLFLFQMQPLPCNSRKVSAAHTYSAAIVKDRRKEKTYLYWEKCHLCVGCYQRFLLATGVTEVTKTGSPRDRQTPCSNVLISVSACTDAG